MLVLVCESLENWHKIRNSHGFSQQVIETSFPCKLRNPGRQVVPQRSPDSAIRRLDQIFFRPRELCTIAFHEYGINAGLTHVIYDHRDTSIFSIIEYLVEEYGLFRPGKTRQEA